MKFRDTRTGATLEPSTEFVAEQMAKNPTLVPIEDKPRRAPRKRAAKKEG